MGDLGKPGSICVIQSYQESLRETQQLIPPLQIKQSERGPHISYQRRQSNGCIEATIIMRGKARRAQSDNLPPGVVGGEAGFIPKNTVAKRNLEHCPDSQQEISLITHKVNSSVFATLHMCVCLCACKVCILTGGKLGFLQRRQQSTGLNEKQTYSA